MSLLIFLFFAIPAKAGIYIFGGDRFPGQALFITHKSVFLSLRGEATCGEAEAISLEFPLEILEDRHAFLRKARDDIKEGPLVGNSKGQAGE